MMRSCKKEATEMAEWIYSLEEPYRQNAIDWLRIYIRRPMDDLQVEIESFLKELDPVVRNYFLIHTRMLRKTAVHYFGAKDWGELSPVGENPEATFEMPPMSI